MAVSLQMDSFPDWHLYAFRTKNRKKTQVILDTTKTTCNIKILRFSKKRKKKQMMNTKIL